MQPICKTSNIAQFATNLNQTEPVICSVHLVRFVKMLHKLSEFFMAPHKQTRQRDRYVKTIHRPTVAVGVNIAWQGICGMYCTWCWLCLGCGCVRQKPTKVKPLYTFSLGAVVILH